MAIVIMLCLKLTSFRPAILSDVVRKFDTKAHYFRDLVYKKVRLYKRIVSLFIFDFLPAYLYEKSVSLKDYLYKKYYESASNLKGNRKILKSSGSVSSFLQEIKLEKPDDKNGFIVDSLIDGGKNNDKKDDVLRVDL